MTSNITFNETGLPAGTLWWAVFGGVQKNTTVPWINFTEPAGNYTLSAGAADGKAAWLGAPWGYPVSSANPSETIAMPQGVPSLLVSFDPHYSFTFEVNGPEPSSWTVQLSSTYTWNCNGLQSSCTTAPVGTTNGTYEMFAGGGIGTLQPLPNRFLATVNGSNFDQILTFANTSTNLTPIAFSESGLPRGAEWNVVANGLDQSSGVNTSLVYEPPGNVTFAYPPVGSERAFPSSGSVEVSGSHYTASYGEPFEAVTFAPPSQSVYDVTFRETGLPNASHYWRVAFGQSLLQSSSNDSVTAYSTNGTSAFSVLPVSSPFAPVPSSGNVTVAGRAQTVNISFSREFDVSFVESGLPSGVSWSVVLDDTRLYSSSSTITFSEPNGSYPYTVGGVPGWRVATGNSTGLVEVQGGNQSVPVAFGPFAYSVTFDETGLPSGTNWTVTINGSAGSASSPSPISFDEPNGTYEYSVTTADTDYSPVSGSLTVNGMAVYQTIGFASPMTYRVVFTEVGLPTGTTWSVVVGGVRYDSTSNTIGFPEPNGSYPFTVGIVSGFEVNRSNGNLTVDGSPAVEPLRFSSMPPGAVIWGLTATELDATIVGILVVIVVAVLVAALLARRRRRTATTPPPSP